VSIDLYPGNACRTVNKYVVALPEGVVDEAEGLFEVRSHSIGGDVKRIDDLVVNAVLLGVVNAEHGCRSQDYLDGKVPARMFFCLRRETLEAA
jgi:hypothetical protein